MAKIVLTNRKKHATLYLNLIQIQIYRDDFSMKNVPILIIEIIIAALLVWFGLSGNRILFLQGPRAATILLGIIGSLLCTISVGKFISTSPAHPLAILGYLLGTIAMIAFLSQIFKWNLPWVGNPKTALIILALCMVAKSFIGRFYYLLKK